MRDSFKKKDVPTAEAVEAELDGKTTETATGLIIRPPMDLLTGRNQSFVGDIQLPWLQLAHGVGGLAKKGFTPGDLVIGGEALVYSPPRRNVTQVDPLKLLIVSYKQYWKEYLTREAFDAGIQPRVFATEADAHAAGLTTQWTGQRPNGIAPTCPAAMTWLVLVEKPKDIMSHYFCIEANGTQYAPAYMSFDKAAYRSVKDAFGMAVNFTLRNSKLYRAQWEMTTGATIAKTTQNESWVPRIKLASVLTDEQVKSILEAFVPPPVVPVDDDPEFVG